MVDGMGCAEQVLYRSLEDPHSAASLLVQWWHWCVNERHLLLQARSKLVAHHACVTGAVLELQQIQQQVEYSCQHLGQEQVHGSSIQALLQNSQQISSMQEMLEDQKTWTQKQNQAESESSFAKRKKQAWHALQAELVAKEKQLEELPNLEQVLNIRMSLCNFTHRIRS
jgi:hypothetical protein